MHPSNGRASNSGIDRSFGGPNARIALVERLAAIGLAILLTASAAYATFAALTMRASVRAVARTAAIDQRYQMARYDVSIEESLERKYRLEGGAAVRAAHERAGDALVSSLARVVRLDATRRFEIATVLRTHDAYRHASALLFDAIDAHRPALASRIDRERVDPVFGRIDAYVDAHAVRHRMEIDRITGRMLRGELNVIGTSIVLSIASVVCLFAYFAVMQTYKRRLERSYGAELERVAATARIDHLTGVGNHRAFKDELARETAVAAICGHELTLALIDVDDMKSINDQNGHVRGDHVLEILGARLRESFAGDRAFRIGGDEFAVLLPGTSAQDAAASLRRLPAGKSLLGASVSIGIATLRDRAAEAELLQSQADAALYAAKRAGRKTVTIFDAAVDEMWALSPAKRRALRELIESEDVRIAFQPIWDVERCDVLAYEALARPSPDYGFAGPQDAFDLAERTGRSHEFDAICRRAILRRSRDLPGGTLLFVNMTPQSFEHGHLDPTAFRDEVVAAGLAPERVVVEITERSVAQIDAVVAVARELQAFGFRLALDDTGAGNAGLEMLSRLAVAFVKIDRAIIVKALTDRRARGVIAGIVAIARVTDAYVIAEGIETVEMLDLVCGIGESPDRRADIRGVQGYLLQRPSETIAPAHDATAVRAMLRAVNRRRGAPTALA